VSFGDFRKKWLAAFAFLTISVLSLSIYAFNRYLKERPKVSEDFEIIRHFSFETSDSLSEWEEKVLHKSVNYMLASDGGESYVRAVSNAACSSLYHKIKLDIRREPILSWKWKIRHFPEKASGDDISKRKEDDFGARMYVIFPAIFFANSKVLEYIWSRDISPGTISDSPYTRNIKIVVAEQGYSEDGLWASEERNIYEDYLEAFGKEPKLDVGAIAFMTDSDSTGTYSEAFFDEIKIYYKR